MPTLTIEQQFVAELNARWKLYPKQAEVIKAIFAGNSKLAFLQCGRKFGKCLDIETPIPTPTGFKLLKEIRLGDFVFDGNGYPTPVTYVSETYYDHKCYKLTFSDGSSLVADENHQWVTSTKLARRSMKKNRGGNSGYPPKLPQTVTTKQIKNTLMHGKEYNHSISTDHELVLPKRRLPLDPYLLGVWLGDGSRNKAAISTEDDEILENFRLQGMSCKKIKGQKHDYSISGLFRPLKDLGFIAKRNEEIPCKYIPTSYLWSDTKDRLALLQGLMDTDGTISDKGYITFDNTNKNLADGVCFLLSSLGIIYRRSGRMGKLYGKEHKYCHRVWFKTDLPMFKLTRKLTRQTSKIKPDHRFITSVEPYPIVPVKCIQVASPEHTYLAGETLIKTHNTSVALYALCRMSGTRPGSICYWFAPRAKQAREIVWASNRLQTFVPKKYIKSVHKQDMRITFWNDSQIKLDGSDECEQYRGTETDFVVYDEFKDFSPNFDVGMRPNLGPRKAPLMVLGTPPRNKVTPSEKQYFALAQESQSRDDGYYSLAASWERADPEWLEELAKTKKLYEARRDSGDEDAWNEWLCEYGGEYVEGGAGSIFPMFRDKLIIDHIALWEYIRPNPRKYEYWCVADPGNDHAFAVLFIALNRDKPEVLILDEIHELDQMENTTNRIVPRIMGKVDEYFPIPAQWHYVYDEAALWFKAHLQASHDDPGWTATNKRAMRQQRPDELKPYLDVIKDCFREGVIKISSRCPNLVREIKSYKKDLNGNLPKKHDDCLSCLRYFMGSSNFSFLPQGKIELDNNEIFSVQSAYDVVPTTNFDYSENFIPMDFNFW